MAITDKNITCFNQQGNIKTVASIRFDGVLYWCRHCAAMHRVTKEECSETWKAHRWKRLTCSRMNVHNIHGEEKLAAKIVSASGTDPDMLLCWCRYCRTAHRITRESCEQVWAQGETVEEVCVRGRD